MKVEQQNTIIAKWMGAKWVKSFNQQTPNKAVLVFVENLPLNYGDEIIYVNESDENFTKVIHAHVPDYCNDLNAMHEAEKTLVFIPERMIGRSTRSEYEVHLHKVYGDFREAISATAAERAEAFLKTIGKWEYAT